MKKIVVFILAFLYLGVSSGISVDIHYCMGKKAGIGLYGNDNDRCGKCGMKSKKNGCCKNDHQFYKLNDSHKNVSASPVSEAPFTILLNNFRDYNARVTGTVIDNGFTNHSPPPLLTGAEVCILHCVFRL